MASESPAQLRTFTIDGEGVVDFALHARARIAAARWAAFAHSPEEAAPVAAELEPTPEAPQPIVQRSAVLAQWTAAISADKRRD